MYFESSDHGEDSEFQYNDELGRLEDLLKYNEDVTAVGGSHYCNGWSDELPTPSMTVDGIGKIAFPILEYQVKQLIEKATRAPYGKGTQTLVDLSVRKVWQVTSTDIKIESTSWNKFFSELLVTIGKKLGMGDSVIRADLYKMLVYDTGGFFK